MSKCDLSIRLEKTDATYAPGEAVRGTVWVTADQAMKCNALTVSLQWRTHGRGNRREGPAVALTLFQGEWNAGDQQSYPFVLTAPAGPATYHGNVLNVDHYVTARADVPWSLDPKAEREILIPAVDTPAYDFGPAYQTPADAMRSDSQGSIVGSVLAAGCFGLPGLAIILGGVGFMFSAVTKGDASQLFPGIFMLLFGLVFAAVGFGVAFMMYKRKLAQQRLGQPLTQVNPNPARPGERVTVQAIVEPRVALTMADGAIEFKGMETVVSGSGTNKTTHTHQVHAFKKVLSMAGRRVEPGETVTVQEVIAIPEDASPTFSAADNRLSWTASLRIGIDGWPDWEKDFPITVRPR
jgi:hypothetical protein